MGKTTFRQVEAIGRTLPDVEVATSWGASALKVRGTMFICMAIHKSAEPNSLVVRMDTVQRDALIEEEPGTYYVTDHYVPYPCVLVRLSAVTSDALRDLVHTAYRFIEPTARKKPLKRSTRT
jgi:hypothetical protein